MMRLNSAMLSASRRKSSSSRMFASKSSTMPTGFASSPRAERAMVFAARRSTRRSASTMASIFGRCTLTTTSCPSCRRAACTCAIDADGALDVGVIEGPHAIEALAELGAVALGEEPLARRDELPELDVRGAEVLEGVAEHGGADLATAADARPEHRDARPEADPGRAQQAAHRARGEEGRHAERADRHPHHERSARHLAGS